MQPSSAKFVTLAGAVLLGLASVAVAHGHDEDMSMEMGASPMASPTINSTADVQVPDSYFRYGDHSGLMMAHISLMTIAWVFVLPIGAQLLEAIKTIFANYIRCYAVDFSVPVHSSNTFSFPSSKCGGSLPGHHLQRQHARFLSQQYAPQARMDLDVGHVRAGGDGGNKCIHQTKRRSRSFHPSLCGEYPGTPAHARHQPSANVPILQ